MAQGKARILIVEDEAAISIMLEDFLELKGYRSWRVASVAEALEATRSQTFDAALVDINLHGEDAYPILRVLQSRDVPCIFTTAYPRETVPSEFDGVPHLEKPYQMEDLAAAISACLNAPPPTSTPRLRLVR